MPAFQVTPAGYVPADPGNFPDYLQFQQDGVDLGGPDADTVNVTNGLTATRGVGESANVITIEGDGLAVQIGGVASGTVNTINIGAGITATIDSSGVLTLTTVAAPELTWRHIDGDGTVEDADISNGISMDATSGSAVLYIPPGVIGPGRSVLVVQNGAASVTFPTQSGINLVYRFDTFDPEIAGQHGIVTLIGQDDGSVLLCGDLLAI
jgi:hypothetical protein